MKEEYEILEKAWRIRVDNLDEPWHYNDITAYGETGNKAKYSFMKSGDHYDMQILEERGYHFGGNKTRDVEYKDIKVSRQKDNDIVLYKGDRVVRHRVSQLIWQEQRDLDALHILNDHPNSLCVVWADCYKAYWGANHAGYTSNIVNAGKYSAEEAYKIVKGSDYSRGERVIMLENALYNKDIDDKITELKEKINRLENCKL